MGILEMDGKRAFCNPRFFFFILVTAVLWYFNTRRFSLSEDVLTIFFNGVGRSTITYITLVVSNAVFGLSICEDLQDNGIRNILCRTSLMKYVVSKITVCMISASAAYFLGTLLYLSLELIRHPLAANGSIIIDNLKEISTFGVLLPDYVLGFILLQILLNGICCGCMAVMSMGISVYVRDGFLILCMPVVLFFLLLLISANLLKLPVDTESMFWIISTNRPCGSFLLTVILYALCFFVVSGALLYMGVKKYGYE